MAQKESILSPTRIFIFVLVGAFIISSFTLSILVIMQMVKEGKDGKKDQTQAQSTPSPTPVNPNSLQGKPMAGFEPIAKIDSLQVIDQQAGNGKEAKKGSNITAHYTGAVAATGIVFQSSKDSGSPVPFAVQAATPTQQGVIDGWVEGIPGMKVGGKRRILIPAAKAYGANPPAGSGIPANADLVFDVELVAVN